MASGSAHLQAEINAPTTVGHGHSIVSSSFGDHANFAYTIINNPTKVDPDALVKNSFYGVPCENRAFVDRPRIFGGIKKALHRTSSWGCSIVALTGLGGMGKTQLMLRYCYTHRGAYAYVFWLGMDSRSTAIQSFRNLAVNLGLDEKIAMDDDDSNKVIEWVRSWLQGRTGWLLLLDNADDVMAKEVFELLPRIGGDVIITSREYITPKSAKVIHVDKMEEDEALALLLGPSASKENEPPRHAREIVAELDRMPLAVNLSRAYIADTLSSYEEYLDMFKTRRPVIFSHRDTDSYIYDHTLETVWRVSFERLQRLNPIAVKILEVCSFLHPDGIPVNLFEKHFGTLGLVLDVSPAPTSSDIGPSSSPPSSLTPGANGGENPRKAVRTAIALLMKLSFVSKMSVEAVDGAAHDIMAIHRLIQKVIQDGFSKEQRAHWILNISSVLNMEAAFKKKDYYAPHSRKVMKTYLSHISYYTALIGGLDDRPSMSEDLHQLLERTIHYLYMNGIYVGTEKLARLHVTLSEAAYGPDDSSLLSSVTMLARLYQLQGKYSEAEPLYRRALAIGEKALGSEHLSMAKSLNYLATLYESQGKYSKAEPLHQRVIEICEKSLGSEYFNTAISLNNLATLYESQGKFYEAEPLYQRVIGICEKGLGSEHPITGQSISNLGRFYYSRGEYSKALPLLERALAIFENALGRDHPYTMDIRRGLALTKIFVKISKCVICLRKSLWLVFFGGE